jgi:hypothetical protein
MTNFRYLRALTLLPFATPTGRIVSQAGYDPETQLYLHLPMDYAPSVPDHPSEEQVRRAAACLVSPWRAYRWATGNDAAGMVSAVLTAICRPGLDICPAVLFDASTQGSGKTKAATALGSLMMGRREGVMPFSGIDDDELRKHVIAGALTGSGFYCLDNIVGFFKSPALAAVLTSGRLQGRVLGASRSVDASIRALFTLTANNMSMDADLQRRTMAIRIDSGSDPTHRHFAFDPVNEALQRRLQIAEAACTLWRSFIQAPYPPI